MHFSNVPGNPAAIKVYEIEAYQLALLAPNSGLYSELKLLDRKLIISLRQTLSVLSIATARCHGAVLVRAHDTDYSMVFRHLSSPQSGLNFLRRFSVLLMRPRPL